jgi:hypothetical protein
MTPGTVLVFRDTKYRAHVWSVDERIKGWALAGELARGDVLLVICERVIKWHTKYVICLYHGRTVYLVELLTRNYQRLFDKIELST